MRRRRRGEDPARRLDPVEVRHADVHQDRRRATLRRALSTASRPSAASPTTSMSSSDSRIMRKPVRTSAWSSVMRTRIAHWSSSLCAGGCRESASSLARQRASMRPAPPGDPSRCPSGNRELRRQSAISEHPPRYLAAGDSQCRPMGGVVGEGRLLASIGPARSTPSAWSTLTGGSCEGRRYRMTSAGSARCVTGCVELGVGLVAVERPDGLLIERLLDAGLR